MATKRDKHAGALATMLHSYGAAFRTAPTVNPRNPQQHIVRSSADTYAILRGGFVVEVKTGHAGTFPLNSEPKVGAGLRQDQIEWGIEFQKQTECIYWVFVVYESEDSPWRVPRDAFLIPLDEVLKTIAILPQKSLPYKAKKGMLIEIQENKLDAVTLWAKYALDWKSGWKVPESHIFHHMYIAPTPQVLTSTIEMTEDEQHGISIAVS